MNRNLILMYPYENKLNTYIKQMREIYEDIYDVDSFTNFLYHHPFRGYKVKAVLFNWVENDKIYYLILYLLWAKIFGVKVIWTFHNKQSHEISNRLLTGLKFKLIKSHSDRILIHSKNSQSELMSKKAEDKTIYVPHIHYIGASPETNRDIRSEMNIPKDAFVFLFVGLIRPYKNIELLISAMHELSLPNALLYIAGKPYSDSYGKEIEKLVLSAKNVMLDLRFIPDSDAKLSKNG